MKPDLKQHIGYWINRARTCIHLAFEKRLQRYDITVAQWCVLLTLLGRHAATVGELATYIDVDKASISRVVERLVQRGLVSHCKGKDRRSGLVELTSEGLELAPRLLEEADSNEEFFFGDFSAAEKLQFQHLLRKILTKVPAVALDGWLLKDE